MNSAYQYRRQMNHLFNAILQTEDDFVGITVAYPQFPQTVLLRGVMMRLLKCLFALYDRIAQCAKKIDANLHNIVRLQCKRLLRDKRCASTKNRPIRKIVFPVEILYQFFQAAMKLARRGLPLPKNSMIALNLH